MNSFHKKSEVFLNFSILFIILIWGTFSTHRVLGEYQRMSKSVKNSNSYLKEKFLRFPVATKWKKNLHHGYEYVLAMLTSRYVGKQFNYFLYILC